ncbi:MAG: D-glycero-alpha-D-manno-heptose-1,7-bisphosphate 7-phosphatase [Solirubrobacterales bacterium]|jgi:D-glycero-D-manno-heptose 1,7-bisphosphate phosphatase
MSRRFVLADRDGTINEQLDYVLSPDQIRLIPGAADALRELRALGLGVVVVTNQSPIARGWLTPAQLESIHDRLSELLRDDGATVDGYYTCPHEPDDGCECRKPGTALAMRAAAEHGFDPAEAFVVGDHRVDVEMGRRLGARTILVLTGHGREELAAAAAFADHVAADLAEAAAIIREEILAQVER